MCECKVEGIEGHRRIGKREFYDRGGFSNDRCVRVTRNGEWAYFYRN